MTTNQNYQQIYRVGGMLDAGFVGQITYTISLDQVYDELDIHFSFDKRLYSESDVTPELIDKLQTLCTAKYDAPTYPCLLYTSGNKTPLFLILFSSHPLNDMFCHAMQGERSEPPCKHSRSSDFSPFSSFEISDFSCLTGQEVFPPPRSRLLGA